MRTWTIAIVIALAACGGSGSNEKPDGGTHVVDAPIDAPELPLGDIFEELKAIPGMTVEERTTMTEGYRFFVMEYDQPMRHQNPGGTRFKQRLTLLHRDYAAPVVVQNSGYNVSTRGTRSQIAQLTNANQLSMEHRYFLPSRPDPADWSELTIAQAAADQHRIIADLKKRIYKPNKFLTTGASKGGMTSLFHRRFYPDDVDATVAYVAPIDYASDAVQSPTNRYFIFLENVGTDPACRQKLKDFQNLALSRRAAMRTRMQAEASFQILGLDRALEFAVEELPFIFWQYGTQSRCATIPVAGATDDAVFKFLDDTVSVAAYGDEDVTAFLPYYHQSATQLSYPISDESYLVGLMYPGQDTAQAYIPAGIPVPAYDGGEAMQDIQAWIASSGTRIMLIYGQNDPWTAGAADLGAATDSYKYIAPNGNHGSSLINMTMADSTAAASTIRRWAGVAAAAAPKAKLDLDPNERTTEQEEFEYRFRNR